jgi:subfamily B ATP-binding cassette protein HlyB/CyaB
VGQNWTLILGQLSTLIDILAQAARANDQLLPALIVRSDGERVLYFRAGQETAETVPIAEIETRFVPTILLVAHSAEAGAAKAASADAADSLDVAEGRKFGFRWFVPELLRHKRIWRDVLLASAAIQLVGLTTPLFTQVIIDKVVVHHTQTTLVVVAFALTMFMLFNAVMTWLRQYLVLHTGNRIDAVLGSQVFRHLLRVPCPFSRIVPPAFWWRASKAWRRSVNSSPAPR